MEESTTEPIKDGYKNHIPEEGIGKLTQILCFLA